MTMQPEARKFLRFLGTWIINTLAVLVAAVLLRGHITYGRWSDLLIASAFLGVLNAFVRPVLMFFALPLLIFTLGLFTLVINALMLYGVGWAMGPPFFETAHFQVDTFWSAFVGAIIISIMSIALNILTGSGTTRITFQRRRPPRGNSHDDDGPVIDV